MTVTLQNIQTKQPHEIASIVQFFENPESPLPFPGQVYLEDHDILHLYLQKDISAQGEAYVVGFTLGLDPISNWFHVYVLLIVAWLFYPDIYKMRPFREWAHFKSGYILAKQKIREKRLSWKDIYNDPHVKNSQNTHCFYT